MDERKLLDRARERFNLNANTLKLVTDLSKEQGISMTDALLQLGIVSRRQLTDLINEPLNAQLRDTQEFD